MDVYSYDGAWGGYTVTKSAKGFRVARWSRVRGELTDDKYFMPYGTAGYGKDADLHTMHNQTMTVGAFLYHVATGSSIGCWDSVRVIRKGHILQ